jgi:hypothetical protein
MCRCTDHLESRLEPVWHIFGTVLNKTHCDVVRDTGIEVGVLGKRYFGVLPAQMASELETHRTVSRPLLRHKHPQIYTRLARIWHD